MLSKQEIFQRLQQQRAALAGFGVKRIGLFGSYLRGNPGPESDIDFLVEFVEGKKSFDNFIGLVFFLEALLQRQVELVTREALSPFSGPRTLREVEYVPFSA
ncbi:MAG: nucleotidyltransferase [Calditrichaeota bacterium]|nr:MAG: nucleotidyltransferase [Calditrichota bacterium]